MEDKVAYIKADDLIKFIDESKEPSMIGFFLKKIIEAVPKVYLSNMEAIIMENKIYNDDVERIVNDPERIEAINAFHRNRKAKRQRKMLFDAILFAAIALMFGVLGIYNLIVPWISFWVSFSVGMYAAFLFGRFFENGKCYGWK